MKENVTLSNACFCYDGSKEANNLIGIFNENFKGNFMGKHEFYYWISNGIANSFYKVEKGFIEISPSDYLQLLTSQPSRLTEEDLKEFNNEINKNEYWTMAGVDGILFDSFINIEYKFFEGYNVPIRTDKNGTPLESFNISYDRVSKFIEYRHKLISPSAQQEERTIWNENFNQRIKSNKPIELFDFKKERERNKLTLRKVEELTGISNPYLSQLENGKIKSPSFKVVQTLHNLYFNSDSAQQDFKIPETEEEVEKFEKDFPIDIHLSESKSEEMRKNILKSAQQEELSQQAQEEGQSFYEFIYDTIDEVLYGEISTSVGIALIDQAVKKEVFQKTSSLQQEVDKMRFMIDNGLGWDDMKNDNVPPQEK